MIMLEITAYAKINLFLEITGKLPSGYHTVDTVMQSVSLSDSIGM
jgi:4-diphosphocytidyl-2-C-methyl-D-erythritol kinase